MYHYALWNTPLDEVPAKTFVPDTANAVTESDADPNTELRADQPTPLFVERKNPAP